MATVFKRGGSRAKGAWYVQWYDHNGRRRTKSTRTTDKATAERIAAKLDADAALRRDGVIDAALERFAREGQRPLDEHIAEFNAALIAKGNTAKHVEMTVARIKFLVGKMSATSISDLTPSAVQHAIKSIHDDGRSLETVNSYLRAIKGFSRWLWRDKRTADDQLVALAGFNTATEDQRHSRRELAADELAYLLAFVERHTLAAHRLSGPDRAMLYRLALGTGFRSNELRSLTPTSFDLDGDSPTVTVEAAYSKRRRRDVQPIRRDLAEVLRPWLDGRPAGDRVFRLMPRYMARTLRADLDAARAAWIAEAKTPEDTKDRTESDFLRYEDSDGRIADFHAMRHAYVSNVVASGASIKTAQTLARHSTPVLTVGRYSHARLHDLQGALEGMPALTPDKPSESSLRATGTEGKASKEALRQAQQSSRGTSQNAARVCDQETPRASAPGKDDARPNVLSVANLRSGLHPGAHADDKRRARDSNSQPLTGHLISNEAASHSLTLQGWALNAQRI